MGGCLNDIKKNSAVSNILNKHQCDLINLLFNDLAARSINRRISKNIFIEFYHLNGLWGETIFHEFNKNNSGKLTFDEFLEVITMLSKGTQDKKLKILFSFYDVDNNGKITYSEFLKMFYSYPKEQLFQILNDEGFKKTLDERTALEFVNHEQQIDKQIEDPQQQQQQKVDDLKKKQSKEDKDMKNQKQIKNNLVKPDIIRNKFRRKICNITYLIKKYIEYLFTELSLNIKQSISYEQFKLLVSRHNKISSFYFEGFHNQLWEYIDNKPIWLTLVPDIEGELLHKIINPEKDTRQPKYLKLIRSAILIFNKKQDELPEQIIILGGLQIDKYEYNSHIRQEYGFKINHQDRYYPEKIYLVESREQQELWMSHLKPFREKKVNEKYQIRDKIGAGNFSIVYKCQNKLTKQILSLKEIKKLNLLKIQFDLICNQLDIISHCHCPYIIKYLEKYENKTHIYLITEYIKDGDLFDYIISKTKLDEYEASLVTYQILLSIKYMNQIGLIHRDMKPENIMIIKNQQKNMIERIKIIDFGFAIYLHSLESMSISQKYVGTPCYTSPEVFFANGKYDQKIDLYSTGVILHLMLTGTLPYTGKSTGEICHSLLTKKLSYDTDIWKNISLDAIQLTSKLLNHDPTKRISVDQALESKWILSKGNYQSNDNN